MYACGWILVPGAIVGIVLALARPRRRVERAFGAMAVAMGLALLGEASVFGSGWGAGSMVEERYTFYALPLVAISLRPLRQPRASAPAPARAAGTRSPAARRARTALRPGGAGLVAGSPFLWGVTQLEVSSGGVVHGAEIVLVGGDVAGAGGGRRPLVRSARRGAAHRTGADGVGSRLRGGLGVRSL